MAQNALSENATKRIVLLTEEHVKKRVLPIMSKKNKKYAIGTIISCIICNVGKNKHFNLMIINIPFQLQGINYF